MYNYVVKQDSAQSEQFAVPHRIVLFFFNHMHLRIYDC